LEKNRGLIDQIEIYNMQDSIHRDPDEIIQFCRFVNELNRQNQREGIGALIPVCGSDATGRSPEIPGMGFIFSDKVIGWNRKRYLKLRMAGHWRPRMRAWGRPS
jgi:hypothetical protein